MLRNILFIGGLFMGAQSSIGFAQSQTQAQVKPSSSKATEGFRKEHAEIKKELAKIDQLAQRLSMQNVSDQKKNMEKIVSFFEQHIKPHAEWEEQRLYPAIDKRASQGPHGFTESMRYEHRIVGRWVGELAAEGKKIKPNASEFTRKTHRLLGLIEAHFEEEEEVLLPILDQSMTPTQFQSEVLTGGSHQ